MKSQKPIMHKCQFKDGVVIKPDGVHSLDPCVYEEVERIENATVIVSKCPICGAIDISWIREDSDIDV